MRFVFVFIFWWAGAGGFIFRWWTGIGEWKKRRRKKTKEERQCGCSYVDELEVIALLQVVQDGAVIEIGQIGHVFDALEFRRIDLRALIFFDQLVLRWDTQ